MRCLPAGSGLAASLSSKASLHDVATGVIFVPIVRMQSESSAGAANSLDPSFFLQTAMELSAVWLHLANSTGRTGAGDRHLASHSEKEY